MSDNLEREQKSSLKKIVISILGWVFIVLLVCFLFKNRDNLLEVIDYLKQIPLQILALLLILQILTQLLLALQWYKISQGILEKPSFSKMLYILTTGSVVEAVTPGAKIGGEATRLYYIKKYFGCNTDIAVNIILIQKSISMSVLFSICLISFIYFTTTVANYFSTAVQILIGCTCLLMIALMVWLLFFTDKLISLLSKSKKAWISKLNKWVISYNSSLSTLSKKQWLYQYGISFLVWILFPFKMFVLTETMLGETNFFVVLAITMISYMIGLIPFTPGGIGTFEGSMVSLFYIVYASRLLDSSLFWTITIVFRFVTFWFVMLISLIFVLVWKILRKENSVG